ncbi:HAD domain-containing protein [Undibacterium arcticum]|uniref:HAD domain-containing protein n=1 Tax=Undibacterium arcticum TaxID=1762892 RepID=A0ABV7EVR3_9BURK
MKTTKNDGADAAGTIMILFLDFDGVLHPDPCDEGERFSRLPAFEALMRDFPAVEIVVSSSWRVARTLDDLRAFFATDIAQRIIGVTPPDSREFPELAQIIGPGYFRQIEIEAWIRHFGRAREPWLVLDDRAYLFRPFLPNLILCDGDTGLTPAVEEKLRQKLNHHSQ